MFTWLFGDRGIPASYRHMDGFGSHTFQWVNAEGEPFWVKFHFKTDQGIECLDSARRPTLAGREPRQSPARPVDAIERRRVPLAGRSSVQVMPADGGGGLPRQPLRPDQGVAAQGLSAHRGRPDGAQPQPRQLLRRCRAVGVRPGQLRPGHRAVAGQDAPGPALRLRRRAPLPPRHQPHPAAGQRSPRHRGPQLRSRRADGSWQRGREKNYEPNSFDGPVETDEPYAGPGGGGATGTYDWDSRHADDFTQAGDLYRLQPADAKTRLVDNIAGGLGAVSAGPAGDGIVERSIAHFRAADPEFGERVAQGVKERRG